MSQHCYICVSACHSTSQHVSACLAPFSVTAQLGVSKDCFFYFIKKFVEIFNNTRSSQVILTSLPLSKKREITMFFWLGIHHFI